MFHKVEAFTVTLIVNVPFPLLKLVYLLSAMILWFTPPTAKFVQSFKVLYSRLKSCLQRQWQHYGVPGEGLVTESSTSDKCGSPSQVT